MLENLRRDLKSLVVVFVLFKFLNFLLNWIFLSFLVHGIGGSKWHSYAVGWMVLLECWQGKISVEGARKKIYLVDSQVLSSLVMSCSCEWYFWRVFSFGIPVLKLWKGIVSLHLIHSEHFNRRVWWPSQDLINSNHLSNHLLTMYPLLPSLHLSSRYN